MPDPNLPKHVFVLMLENRSFDHMLGFSGLYGTDAATGSHTRIEGLTGEEANTYQGTSFPVTRHADFALDVDPGHEFHNVLDQLCGPGTRYAAPYPPIDGSGFVDSYVQSGGGAAPGEIMKCFDTPRQLPILHALAQMYAVCDHWFSSMPGPTWPNRMFLHAASSGGLDHSPTTSEILGWEFLDGFTFPGGTIFDSLRNHGKRYRIYSGDQFPMVAALKGIDLTEVQGVANLAEDLQDADFPYSYVFIEPSYFVLDDFRKSSCQHPLADVRDGEKLIKDVYEAVRNSPLWPDSLLVITWDEHGGFYDHVTPPRAPAPGDGGPGSKHSRHGFTFEQYGVRVPAVVVSPRIQRNTIDHRLYDHASVPATLRALFGLEPLTARDRAARTLLPLLLPPGSEVPDEHPTELAPSAPAATVPRGAHADDGTLQGDATRMSRPDGSVNDGSLPAVIHSALRQQIAHDPKHKTRYLAKVAGLETRADALAYLREVQDQLQSGG